jgi:hypothetical protein
LAPSPSPPPSLLLISSTGDTQEDGERETKGGAKIRKCVDGVGCRKYRGVSRFLYLDTKRMYSLTGFRDPREGFIIIGIWLPVRVSTDES